VLGGGVWVLVRCLGLLIMFSERVRLLVRE
jgi:hypothetical protein